MLGLRRTLGSTELGLSAVLREIAADWQSLRAAEGKASEAQGEATGSAFLARALASARDDLILLTRLQDGSYRYDHYGLLIVHASGFDMTGKRTSDFPGAVGEFFVASYDEALARREPVVTVNAAALAASVQTWVRVVFPVPGEGGGPDRILAWLWPKLKRHDLWRYLAGQTAFGAATLEPTGAERQGAADHLLLMAADAGALLPGCFDGRLASLVPPAHATKVATMLAVPDRAAQLVWLLDFETAQGWRATRVTLLTGGPGPTLIWQDVTAERTAQRDSEQSRVLASRIMRLSGMGYYRVLASAPARIWLSQELQAMLGVHIPDGWTAMAAYDAGFAPHDVRQLAELSQRLFATGAPYTLECGFRRDDGTQVMLEISATAERDPTGAIMGRIGYVRDITDAARRRQDLANSEARFRDFAGVASDWYWETDADHRFTHFTEAFERFTGIAPADMIGRQRLQMPVIEEDRALIERHVDDLVARRPFRDLVYRLRKADGRLVWIKASGNPRFASDGAFLGYRGSGADVSEEQQRKLALEQSRRTLAERTDLLSRAMTHARMGHWRAENAEADPLWVSAELATLWGLDGEGWAPLAKVQEGDLPDAHQSQGAAFRATWGTARPHEATTRYRTGEGDVIHMVTQMFAETNAAGEVVSVTGVVRDITVACAARRAAEEAREQLERAERIADVGNWRFDGAAQVSQWSPMLYEVLGFDPDRGIPDLRQIIGRLAPEVRDTVAAAFQRIGQQTVHEAVEGRYRHPEKGWRHLRIIMEADADPLTRAPIVYGTAQDVTDLREQSASMADAHRLGRIGRWSVRLGSDHVQWGPEVYGLLRLDPAVFTPTRKHVLGLYEGNDADAVLQAQADVMRTGQVVAVDVQVLRGDGTRADVTVTTTAETDEAGRVIGFVGTIQDITERKAAERDLEALAFYDPLTGLANRALFLRRLHAITDRRASAPEMRAVLMLMDLDRFKEVNDSLGHTAGDELLARVAELLRARLPASAFLARLGGDEFAVLLEQGDLDQAQTMARTLIDALAQPIQLMAGEVIIGVSIGLAALPEHGECTTILMRNADLALYQAKDQGRGRAAVFEISLSERMPAKTRLARDLRTALEAPDQLRLAFQPQLSLSTGKVAGFEALVRWVHPERGPIPPSDFIPVAVSSSLICDVGLWVLRASCREAVRWRTLGEPHRDIAVNVSAAQLWQTEFDVDVARVLDETGLPPECLTLEVTESVFVSEAQTKVRRALDHLAQMGVKLALDDFGTGYSSLGYLNQMNFHKLKIDRCFVHGAERDAKKRGLLEGIIALGRGLGLTTVAEGAEDTGEIALLRAMGCDVVQGFGVSKPLTAPDALAFAHTTEAATQGFRLARAGRKASAR